MIGWRQLSLAMVLSMIAAACGRGRGPEAGFLRSDVARATGDADAAPAVAAVNGFGSDLLASYLGVDRGNVVVSPWSIVTALAMARAGARGGTEREIDRVLHVTDPAAVDAAFNRLSLELAARNGTFPGPSESLEVEVAAADRAFAQKGVAFSAPFLDTLARYYGAGVGIVDYEKATEASRKAINAWVSDETRRRIPELLAQGTLDGMTRLVLVNAVYLNADWASPFDHRATSDASFHAPAGDVNAPFMHNQERYGYARGDGWVAVTLPYAGNALAMTVVLPDPDRFDAVAGDLHAVLDTASRRNESVMVNLALPKFDIAFLSSLRAQLAALGMVTAFDAARADFSGMTDEEKLYVSDVVHAANLTVDEKGTVAAAATAVIMRATSAPERIERVTVDRPFVFALRDIPTGTVLFEGQVTNPSVRT